MVAWYWRLEMRQTCLPAMMRANQWYDYNHPWQQWHAQFNSYARIAAAPGQVKGIENGESTMELFPNPAHDILSFASTSIFDPASV
jgi:hypothetical protein